MRLFLPCLLLLAACRGSIGSVDPEDLAGSSVHDAAPDDQQVIAGVDLASAPDLSGALVDLASPAHDLAMTAADLAAPDASVAPDQAIPADLAVPADATVVADASSPDAAARAMKPDFGLLDVNPNSSTTGTLVSPRDHLGHVSAWYFGHAT